MKMSNKMTAISNRIVLFLILVLLLSKNIEAATVMESVNGSSASTVTTTSPTVTTNFFLENGTTTNANDSINITGQDAALSGSNIGYVNISHQTTAGVKTTFSATADIKILVTGAHWGLDTTGDVTGAILRVYAINDNGSLKWGIAYQGGRNSIASTATSATQADINLPEEILVNTALAVGTWPMTEVGWFRADFDDTGGAAENLWALQTGIDDYGLGTADGLWQPWNTLYTGFSANPTNTTKWTQVGACVTVICFSSASGTSNATTFTMTLPVKAVFARYGIAGPVVNNSVGSTVPGRVTTAAASTTLTIGQTLTSDTWTGSGGKACDFTLSYDS